MAIPVELILLLLLIVFVLMIILFVRSRVKARRLKKQSAQKLQQAHEKSDRAKSMAQQTKQGYVYIISNIGSFGRDVYKVGMTRRLDPLERVKELSDASVPFPFDIHAMIHTDDAPALENALHRKFNHRRLNLVNNKKEFFRVSLAEIESEVRKYSPNAEFVEMAEARDYRESQSILAQQGLNR